MTQKVLRVGTSAAVTIPKHSLQELGIKIGDRVSLTINKQQRTVAIRPTDTLSDEDTHIARLAHRFIQRYRKDLEELARL